MVAALILTAGGSTVLAAAIAYLFTIVTHFSMQRYWVFGDRREEQASIREQLPTYLVTVLVQWAFVAATTAPLARWLGIDERLAYVAVVIAAAGCSYVVFARIVFGAR